LAKEYKMSQERLDELKKELIYLKTVREKEVADQIKEARSFGDLSENSEYDEAKNEQGKLYSRIVELGNILAHAIVIDEDDLTTDAVGIGSRVMVEAMDSGSKGSYQIVGSQEADPMNGRISEESPFGQALLGKRCGEEVLVSAPAGTIHYRVIEIQK
jgi:transcription elongation factor GreA